jgi:hypothetical protein
VSFALRGDGTTVMLLYGRSYFSFSNFLKANWLHIRFSVALPIGL